jgi:mycothiol synthase
MSPLADILTRPAADHELPEAVRQLIAHSPLECDASQYGELLRLAARHRGNAGGMRIALHQDRMLASVLPVTSPGRTMLLFVPPRHSDPLRRQALARLIDEVCAQAVIDGIVLAQVLLDHADGVTDSLLGLCGFRRLAELLYLHLPVARGVAPPAMPSNLIWRTYAPHLHEAFGRTLLETYRQSLDCPALNGLRDISDVLAGHMAAGAFDPSLWFLLMADGQGIGAALLTRTPGHDGMELVYLGLAPEYRRRGYADLLMRQALAAASARGATQLSLAVDSDNLPALRLYWRHGFQAFARKTAMLRDLRTLQVSVPAASQTPGSVQTFGADKT